MERFDTSSKSLRILSSSNNEIFFFELFLVECVASRSLTIFVQYSRSSLKSRLLEDKSWIKVTDNNHLKFVGYNLPMELKFTKERSLETSIVLRICSKKVLT